MNPEEIGKIIKDIRQKHNMSQKDFADKFGVTYQAVSKWENGKNIPDIAILKEISEEYEISLDRALTKEDTSITISYTVNGTTKTAEVNITVILKGDVNGDNEVDFKDILQINKHRLGKVQLTGIYLEAAEVTGDGQVDFRDILQINKYRLRKINSL